MVAHLVVCKVFVLKCVIDDLWPFCLCLSLLGCPEGFEAILVLYPVYSPLSVVSLQWKVKYADKHGIAATGAYFSAARELGGLSLMFRRATTQPQHHRRNSR